MRAIRVDQPGGPDVLTLHDDVADPVTEPGTAVVRVAAAGVNFIDTYQRSGSYPIEHPWVAGLEGAGVVEAVADDVDRVATGDTVAWALVPGSYAERVTVPADELVAVPAGVDLATAAAVMLQGMTAHYLARSTFPLSAGHTALVYAAAGGVGHLLTQVATRSGARILATASSEAKAELARGWGADEVIPYRDVDLVSAVRAATDDRGVDVVYDSVGADTFDASLDCLAPRGTLVLYGQSSGRVEPVDPQTLAAKGSLFLTRPSLAHYIATPAERTQRATELFDWIAAGELTVNIDRTFPLAEAADAHRYLEAGRTTGKLLLKP